jgi:hypothetical protein
LAMARPRPLDPPVISAARPFKVIFMEWSPFYDGGHPAGSGAGRKRRGGGAGGGNRTPDIQLGKLTFYL